ncbi:hypothetical protein ACPPVU_06155 [Mucilaginibacter sp. McL0603]|uniref:hypothetical protein n=1 Tax=Mucilaginibacter sp. McL0603 TaxID=3415670 RepID=UPI003CF08B60
MQINSRLKSAVLAAGIVLAFLISWELYLRHKGVTFDYDDGPELWSNSRAMVYEPADKTTVFIGSSRIKYDLDIPTWERLTGNHAIQLSMVGSNPRPFLHDLASDTNFKGKLMVDVTEGLFFSKGSISSPIEAIEYYKKRTPAQRASFELNHLLESQLVFLNKGFFSLNPLLNKLHPKNRDGVITAAEFPISFRSITFERQNKMTDEFLADTNQQVQVKNIWAFNRKNNHTPPITGKALDTIINSVKADVDKIRARGGDVIFLRTPSSGTYLIFEKKNYPRNLYWDKLLTVTRCRGIHFADYPVIDQLTCPEYSHLSPKDAVIYTQNLVNILKKEQIWGY